MHICFPLPFVGLKIPEFCWDACDFLIAKAISKKQTNLYFLSDKDSIFFVSSAMKNNLGNNKF